VLGAGNEALQMRGEDDVRHLPQAILISATNSAAGFGLAKK
jgi:hypothetical protein